LFEPVKGDFHCNKKYFNQQALARKTFQVTIQSLSVLLLTRR
jgi:hypothetical protein